jgi:hypothetical protein
MRIDQVIAGVSTPPRAGAVAQQGWLVGQLLTIGVIGRLDDSSMRLMIDGREVVARTTLDLKPGTELTARVSAAGTPPQLTIVAPGTTGAAPAAQVLSNSLSIALPAQEPIRVVLDRLSLATAPGMNAADTGTEVQTRLVTLNRGLPDLPALGRPSELTRAVAQTGPLLEATLATLATAPDRSPTALPTQDLKFQLLGLRQAIDHQAQLLARHAGAAPPISAESSPARPAVPTVPMADPLPTAPAALRALAADVEAGIARITTNQLQHLAAAASGEYFVFTEIPFRTPQGVDTIAMEIERDGRQHGGPEAETGSAALTLAIPLDALGELRARIGLSGDRLAVTLWSEDPALRELLGDGVSELEQRLVAVGFELSPIAVRHVDAPDPLRHLPRQLIDTAV